ncbi:MAG: FkbM family methyltransferase [Chloroflexota bacterium]
MFIDQTRDILLAVTACSNWREIASSIVQQKPPTTVLLKNGPHIRSSQNPLPLVREIFFENVYTPKELSIGANDVVVDIGANVGVFSLYAASRTKNHVYSFEPLPSNYEFLQRNAAANHFEHITAFCTAVSDSIGMVKLYMSDSVAGNLLFDHNINGKLEKYIEVPTTTLPAIMDDNKLTQIDFLKLDCEGSEGAILTSTPLEYLRRIGKIAMEFHDNVSSLDHNGLQNVLRTAGFSTMFRWNGRSPFGYLYGWR